MLATAFRRLPGYVLLFLAADVTLAALFVINTALGEPFDFPTRLVALNRESNLPTWFSSLQLGLGGAVLALAARSGFRRANARTWPLLLLPVPSLLLSLDETAQIHEWMSIRINGLIRQVAGADAPHIHTVWLFVLVPAFLAMVWAILLLLRPYLEGRRDLVVKLLLGFVVVLGSAGGAEFLGSYFAHSGAARVGQLVVEELGEMVGGTLLLWAAVDLARSLGVDAVRESG